MKDLFIKLSNAFSFLREKRFVYLDAPKPAPEMPGGKKVEAMARSANEQERLAREAAAAQAKKAADLPGLDEAVARLTGKGKPVEPEAFKKEAEKATVKPEEGVAAAPKANVKAQDIGLAAHDDFGTTLGGMPPIEKKGPMFPTKKETKKN